MRLTDEQVESVDQFQRFDSSKMHAFAGTGKTTTLAAIGKCTHAEGAFVAFNKSIADEARTKFPRNVHCKTTHSLALASLPVKYSRDKLFANLQGNRITQLLDIDELAIAGISLNPRSLGFLIGKTIQRFCQSADEELLTSHVPLHGKLEFLAQVHQSEIQRYVAQRAAHLWDRMLDPNDEAPLGHDGYLKLWSLSAPDLGYDFILLDEAQDTNEAVLSVLRKKATRIALVGDSHQQIYEWRGAVNAMAKFRTAAESALTQSFRFGPEIAEFATRILRDLGETRTLRGNPAIKSSIATTGEARTVLCRTNAGVIDVVLHAVGRGEPLHVIGGVGALVRMLEDVTRLKKKDRAQSAELFGFADWDEVVAFARSEVGESLRSFVTIVNANGEKKLIEALAFVKGTESVAGLVVSTAHKSKGREWHSVRLHSDFSPRTFSTGSQNEPLMCEEENRLFYVACTRAQVRLIVPPQLAFALPASTGVVHRVQTTVPVEARARIPKPVVPPKPLLPQTANVVPVRGGQPASAPVVSPPGIAPITVAPTPARIAQSPAAVTPPRIQPSSVAAAPPRIKPTAVAATPPRRIPDRTIRQPVAKGSTFLSMVKSLFGL